MSRTPVIAVIGAGEADAELQALAEATGYEIASAGATLICGGLGGVMESAARGARSAGGHTIGILPGISSHAANQWIEFVIATGLGEARNAVIVGSADGVIALSGEGGTLAEIGFALKLERPIVALRSWPELVTLKHLKDPQEAVTWVMEKSGLEYHYE